MASLIISHQFLRIDYRRREGIIELKMMQLMLVLSILQNNIMVLLRKMEHSNDLQLHYKPRVLHGWHYNSFVIGNQVLTAQMRQHLEFS